MRKILVIEDDQPIRQTIADTLEFADFEVLQAENGRVGVNKAQESIPDLIICDVMMPELDGYGVLAEIREYPTTATIPLIFLTAKSATQDRRRGMDLGADDFLTKPFRAQELLSAVETRLRKHDTLVTQARDDLEGIRDFLNMSLPHELRTPLSVMMGYLNILIEDFGDLDKPSVQRILESVLKSTLRLHRLTENYLANSQLELLLKDPSRLETLRENAVCEEVDRVINGIASALARTHGREDDLHTDCEKVSVGVLDSHLKKALEEIIDNAFKFSPTGSPVTIRARREGDAYVLKLSNHGRGMTAKQIAEVAAFVQFERKTHEQQGLGLGLVIAKRLAEVYAGSLHIESVVDGETTFTLRLPAAQSS